MSIILKIVMIILLLTLTAAALVCLYIFWFKAIPEIYKHIKKIWYKK